MGEIDGYIQNSNHAPGWAVLLVPVALVRHEVVEGVGPDGDAGERGDDGRVVREELVGHHAELEIECTV